MIEDEEPNQHQISLGKNFVFIFVLDRSGSMKGERIYTAKEALKLFMKSLPVGSKFGICSFGSMFEFMEIGGEKIIDYNDATAKQAITLIDTFEANMGGTNIYRPLKAA